MGNACCGFIFRKDNNISPLDVPTNTTSTDGESETRRKLSEIKRVDPQDIQQSEPIIFPERDVVNPNPLYNNLFSKSKPGGPKPKEDVNTNTVERRRESRNAKGRKSTDQGPTRYLNTNVVGDIHANENNNTEIKSCTNPDECEFKKNQNQLNGMKPVSVSSLNDPHTQEDDDKRIIESLITFTNSELQCTSNLVDDAIEKAVAMVEAERIQNQNDVKKVDSKEINANVAPLRVSSSTIMVKEAKDASDDISFEKVNDYKVSTPQIEIDNMKPPNIYSDFSLESSSGSFMKNVIEDHERHVKEETANKMNQNEIPITVDEHEVISVDKCDDPSIMLLHTKEGSTYMQMTRSKCGAEVTTIIQTDSCDADDKDMILDPKKSEKPPINLETEKEDLDEKIVDEWVDLTLERLVKEMSVMSVVLC